MKKRRGTAGIVVMSVLCSALLLCTAAEANRGTSPAKLMISTGKLLVTTPQGERVVYEKAGEDIMIVPRATLIALTGTCVVKVDNAHFALDAGDSLAYEPEDAGSKVASILGLPGDSLTCEPKDGLKFRCLTGTVEVFSGQKTRKLGQDQIVALSSSPDDADWSQVTATRARSVRHLQQTVLEVKANSTAPGGMLPVQGGAYNEALPWEDSYGGQSPWTSASPAW